MALGALAVGGALVLDGAVGEPPDRLHPVAWFGRAVPDRAFRRPVLAGGVLALLWPLAAALAVGGAVALAGLVDPLAAAAVGALALFVTTSLRRLLATVRRVVALTESDLASARAELRALAGRDAAALSPGQVRSAAVESLAENLADGLVAPLLWYGVCAAAAGLAGVGAVGALAVGCGAAAWVKAVNTLDSMLGYRGRPVGRIPARLDDAVMWVPARASALLLAAATGRPGALLRARSWLSAVPSPNSGWPMGTLAAALDVRLEKPGVYTLNPEGRFPDAAATRTALVRTGVAGLLAYGLAAVVTWS
ncbi:CobD/CbiB family cobalamin biosynthesis protein [Salinirussus salinus]|jgi:adenosylcobinamide-phosphate synthase|uniref:CobD/CbiB family cobalamin biosynthesis protein n=1 Tax=Salinirussus salinus TaxID=1198300 RepID=UPI00135BA280|nr:CobD/CbiB family cobalamin biosynthesis protein [Salinirussus salinus]